MRHNTSARGFVLLEVMLAVAIFSVGVIALGQCVNNCIVAEIARTSDQKARLALENRVAELRAGAVDAAAAASEKMTGMFDGITLTQARVPLEQKNENGEAIVGLFVNTVTASWVADGEPQAKSVTFYELEQQ